jgi:hypothetical protein
VQIDHTEEGLELALIPDPVADGPDQVPQVDIAGWLDATEDALAIAQL